MRMILTGGALALALMLATVSAVTAKQTAPPGGAIVIDSDLAGE